jgi:hypothetical protein
MILTINFKSFSTEYFSRDFIAKLVVEKISSTACLSYLEREKTKF